MVRGPGADPVRPTALDTGRAVLAALIRAGVTEVVACPGSRNGPVLIAAAEAERAGSIRLHVRSDERVAGFLALGLARVSGGCVVVVTTSGSAPGHLHPALIEARESGVALLALTADRPEVQVGTGANQTTVQPGMYGPTIPSLVVPATAGPAAAAASARTVVQSALGVPGPVHLNLALAEPLLDDAVCLDPSWCPPAAAGRVTSGGEAAGHLPGAGRVTSGGEAAGAGRVPGATGEPSSLAGRRGLILLGDAPGVARSRVDDAARRLGWPIIAEPVAAPHDPWLTIPHGSLLAGLPGGLPAALTPEVVLAVGRVGLARGVAALLKGGAEVLTLAPAPTVTSPPGTLIPGDAARWLAAVAGQSGDPAAPAAWLAAWQAAGRAAERVIAEVVEATVPLTGPAIAREVLTALPASGLLQLAASLPARDADSYAPPAVGAYATGPVRVVMNRGVNGIDGQLASATGAALAHMRASPGAHCVAVLGDLAAFHDLTGLLQPAAEPVPDLTVVIVDNDGGGIFNTLEQAGREGFERVYATPTGRDLATVLTGLGLPVTTVTTAAHLRQVLADRVRSRGVAVIRALTMPRAEEAHWRVRLSSLIADALGEEPAVSR